MSLGKEVDCPHGSVVLDSCWTRHTQKSRAFISKCIGAAAHIVAPSDHLSHGTDDCASLACSLVRTLATLRLSITARIAFSFCSNHLAIFLAFTGGAWYVPGLRGSACIFPLLTGCGEWLLYWGLQQKGRPQGLAQ